MQFLYLTKRNFVQLLIYKQLTEYTMNDANETL